jgi:hypothetical protein
METSPVLLQFSANAPEAELREACQILATSPGDQRVQISYRGAIIDAGRDLSVNLTRELEEKLTRWLVTSKSERRADTNSSAS